MKIIYSAKIDGELIYFTQYTDALMARIEEGTPVDNVIRSLTLLESYGEFHDKKTLKVKKEAMAKLTHQEQQALGLTAERDNDGESDVDAG